MTADRRELFLKELREHGILARAARAASPHSSHPDGALASFRDERAKDAEFAAAWDEALEEANALIESEIRRRAVEGFDEPIFQKGVRVMDIDPETGETTRPAVIRRYSDRMLELLARARLPQYRERLALDAAVKADLTARRADEVPALLSYMTDDELREIEGLAARQEQILLSADERRQMEAISRCGRLAVEAGSEGAE